MMRQQHKQTDMRKHCMILTVYLKIDSCSPSSTEATVYFAITIHLSHPASDTQQSRDSTNFRNYGRANPDRGRHQYIFKW